MDSAPERAGEEPDPVADGDADTALGGTAQFCYLTTTGRRTGRTHTIEVWFGEHAGRLFLLAGGGERADWVRNLRANPAVGLRVGTFEGPATAAVVTDQDDDALARELLAAKYQGWEPGRPMSGWAETALAVVVVPGAAQAGAEGSSENP